jgi:hypothetical protein
VPGIIEKLQRKKVLVCGWVQSVVYMEEEGRVCLRFNKDMLPYLSELSAQFTKYRLKNVAKMDSAYAIRLYELLAQWRDIGKREMALDWLRETFQLGGKYPSVKDFKKRVLDVALTQINEHSDLTASYTQRKTGRNVTHLIFTFTRKPPPQPAEESAQKAEARSNPELLQRLRKLGLGAKLAKDWIKQDPARAQAAAAYTEARVQKGQVKAQAAGYLRAVFESGADLGGQSVFEADLKAQARVAEESARREQAEAKRAEEARREQSSRELELAEQWFEALPEAGQRALEEAFLVQANLVDAGMYRKKGHSYLGFRLFAKQAWKQAGQVA